MLVLRSVIFRSNGVDYHAVISPYFKTVLMKHPVVDISINCFILVELDPPSLSRNFSVRELVLELYDDAAGLAPVPRRTSPQECTSCLGG